jgi:hypothetical protein
VERNLTLSIPTESRYIDFNVTIAPKSMLTYAKINGMIIVPKTNSDIYSDNTTYYPTGEILEVNTYGAKEFQIFTARKAVPAIVIANNMHWDYDQTERMLTISGKENLKSILIYWGESGNPVTFLEDTRKLEISNNKIFEMGSHLVTLKGELENATYPVKILRSEIENIDNMTSTTIDEQNSYKKGIGELNATASDIENSVTGKVVLSPALTVGWIVISIILVLLILDVALFKKGDKK